MIRSLLSIALAILLSANAISQITTVTLEPSADNTIFSENAGELSNGKGDFLFSGTTDDGHFRRALLRFDLSSIPEGVIIDSASLSLSVSKSIAGNMDAQLHVLTRYWGEGNSNAPGQEGKGTDALPGDATWLHSFYDTSGWETPGGDFLSEPVASAVFGNTGSAVFESTALTSNLNDWIANPSENFGWILIVNESVKPSAKRFYSKDYLTDISKRPKLIIHYEPVTFSGNAFKEFGAVSIASEPGRHEIVIYHDLPSDFYRLSVFDLSGTLVSVGDVLLEPGINRVPQEFHKNGLYLVKMQGSQGIFTGKIIF